MIDDLKPGTEFIGKSGEKFKIISGPVSYQGKNDCVDRRCSHRYDSNGEIIPGCFSYHCTICDEPCSMMGHKKCQ